MPLFQQAVLRKYIADLDKEKLAASWKVFQAHFHNAQKQENIRAAKEEQYQEGFLRDLFVDILGYTLNPQPGYNLTTEYKNEKDGKKADGAILNNAAVRAVIELKGTDTTDLSKIESQAFGYLHNQKGCTYVVTSNFEKLRFYIQDATEHIEFNLFTLTKEGFDLLFLCLQKDSLLADLPLQVKQQSLTQEDAVTKKLYADYSRFKGAIYQNLVANNPQHDKLELFRKTQKLLDRFLFILFAEDRLLLPPNFILRIVDEYKQVQKLRMQQSLYERFKLYFADLLQGNKDQDIFAYNGGLFSPDELLDNLVIADDVLLDGVVRLSNYDYNSEVDVNILGHIFEHSLNEIEKIEQEVAPAHPDLPGGKATSAQGSLAGELIHEVASLQSKAGAAEHSPTGGAGGGRNSRRKKEGVFYTPRYITKYIVENTVGALCRKKKEAMAIVEEDYAPDKRKRDKKALLQKLDDYRDWLLQLTICDPACGSGAFLNAALEFLIAEHSYVDELTNKLTGASLEFRWTPNDILEHNLFGVDINEEAVEIARLSLWLRTAQKGRKLSNLSSNIKVGNSLIDDKTVAGDKAFNWKEEFKEVFDKGGFDVVIGNPPYVKVQNLKHEEIDWFKQNKKVAHKRIDISIMFFELSKMLLKENGLLSFITSNQFLVAEYGRRARQFILENFGIENVVDFGDLPVFEDALTYVSIFTFRNSKKSHFDYKRIESINEARQGFYKEFQIKEVTLLSDDNWVLTSNVAVDLLSKISVHQPLNSFGKCYYGIVSGNDDVFILNKGDIKKYNLEDGCLLPLIRAQNCYRYDFSDYDLYVVYPYKLNESKTQLMPESTLSTQYPNTYKYLLDRKVSLEKRKDSRETFENSSNWYSLTRFGQLEVFNSNEKIVFPGEQKTSKFGIDKNKAGYSGARVFSVVIEKEILNIRFLLSILNSKLINFYIKSTFPLKQGGYYSMSSTFIDKIPVAVTAGQQPFIAKADIMLSKNGELHKLKQSLLQFVQAKHEDITISKKLADWPQLSFKQFLGELEKQKVKLSLAEQAEWLPYFEEQKRKAANLQNIIHQTDKEIDAMVYALYGLTEEEIKIVEGN
ncbi:Eco57I restriction-modification methylase domain-containing protein [Flavisolibacter ginsenosidimutans]|uniref:site-specific DNA-methyltransferase (adenine-specific) n=1 Tax=Flavisolibacter ginsenosidimutans TaxID=661481 RepID=A0A5B8UJ42_9BACT|nr:DNA methyltransferase [Flavisolibacter ginsenosidimutans]QEC56416.1 N-6 DNA methylase [Flavisolibacter ginsenosidimutans]